ncbi:MAG TPA: hypothetical protein VJO72_01295, partial [Candidatus Dormibacteraeota bacterium]|nr:hypothetical protein [Candidatus Dormibacteraeota bacterium]
MVTHPSAPVPQTSHPFPRTPLRILRTETVLSRFPIHNLTTHGRVSIHLRRTNAQGDLDYLWDVSTSAHYGPPGPLAYKLDTLVINRLLDALPRPVPSVLHVGSLRQVAPQLGLNTSGRQQEHLKSAFHQNASAYIVTQLRYRDRDGRQRRLEAGFTRYSVVLQGERLPDGTPADAIYLVLSEPYREILNHAPVRPLDYTYLQALTPMAQRFYELLSYHIFATLTHRRPQATLRYGEYCLLATQQRHTAYEQVKKQMYKVHRPHLAAGYLAQVRSTATTDADGQPDWLLHYTPGPKARAEYAAFRRQPGVETALPRPEDAEPADLLALMMPETPVSPASAAEPPHPQAVALVQQFYQRFHGLTGVTPMAKELTQATALLTTHGLEKAQYLLTFSHQAAQATRYDPQVFGGILHYMDRALAAYDARAAQGTHATTRQAVADERTQREQYQAWEQQALAQLRVALPPEELAALEAEAQARLVAAGTPAYALGLAVRV